MTTGEWMQTWIDLYIKPSGKAPRTVQMYQRAVRTVSSALASIDLQELTPVDVQREVVALAAIHPRSAQIMRLTCMRALKTAKKCGLTNCLLDEDTLPRIEHKAAKQAVLTVEQARAYVRACEQQPLGVLLLLCLCGLRRGQALGVMMDDLDLDAGTLHVQRQRYRVGKVYLTAPLKTSHSDRILLLPSFLIDLIRHTPVCLSGFVCDTTPEELTRAHKAILATIGANCTLHGLRHTFATLAAANGMSIKLLQGALGHAQYSLTADLYADHMAGVQEAPEAVFRAVIMSA